MRQITIRKKSSTPHYSDERKKALADLIFNELKSDTTDINLVGGDIVISGIPDSLNLSAFVNQFSYHSPDLELIV